jgi:hypothetical protein
MTGEDALYNEFKVNSSLIFHAGFSLSEINNMIPFERDTYLQLWNAHVEEKAKEQEKARNNNGLGLNF